MSITLTGYWNRFDRSKGYKRHLYRAARGLQSAEMNEIHDYNHDNFRQFVDFLVGDGVLLQGGGINLNEDSTSCLVEAGAFIAEGYVLELVARSNIPVTDIGTYNIGAIFKEEVITELEDPTLRDPATSTRNFNEPGAGTLKITAVWGLDSEAVPATERFYPIHKVVDGIVISGKTSDVPENIVAPYKELTARYDRDANGDYIVDGYGVSFLDDNSVEEEHIMVVDAGRAHVYGYERNYSTRTKIPIRWGTDSNFVNNEPISFTGDGWYSLRGVPISHMLEVFGIARITDEVLTRSPGIPPNDEEEVIHQPLVAIEVVSQHAGGGGIVYQEGVDWTQHGNAVNWELAGAEPSSGTTYHVQYTHNKDITSTVNISTDKTQIEINGLISGTVANVDYYKFIPRYDRILIDREGNFDVIEGTADEAEFIKPPLNFQGLPLADILVEYGSTPIVIPTGTRAYQMKDIEYIMSSIADMRYNMSRMAQITDADLRDPSTDKKNMFVDAFHDEDLMDMGVPDFNNSMITDGNLQASISWLPKPVRTGSMLRLPFVEVLRDSMKNTAYSKTRKVNEFDVVVNEQSMTISPKTFQWISSFSGTGAFPRVVTDPSATIPTVPNEGGPVNIAVNGGIFGTLEMVALYMDGTQVLDQGTTTLSNTSDPDKFIDGQHYWMTDVTGNFSFNFNIPPGVKACRDMSDSILIETLGYTTDVGASDSFFAVARSGKTATNAVKGQLNFMRSSINQNASRIGSLQRGVSQVAKGLTTLKDVVDPLTGTVARLGQRVTTIERTPPPQIIQNFSQNITKVFPTRNITVVKNNTVIKHTTVNKTVVNNHHHHSTVVKKVLRILRIRRRFRDPLAQTFVSGETSFLTSAEIFITTKPANVDPLNNYIEVAIHAVQVGIPDRNIKHAFKILRSEDLTEGAWNKFIFDEPFLAEEGVEYALVVFSPDTGTYIQVSEVGQYNLESGNVGWMEAQPHGGVLLQSANRSTWTAFPKEDLTFKINQAEFQLNQADYSVGIVSVTDATDLNLIVGYDEYPTTKANFYCLLNDRPEGTGLEFHQLPMNETIQIEKYTGDVEVFMFLGTGDTNLSPVIDGDITLSVGTTQFPVRYTSRAFNIDLTDTFSNMIKVWLDIHEPALTSVTVQLQTSGDGTDPVAHWTDVPMHAQTPIGEGWMDTEYRLSGLQSIFGALVQQVRLRLVLETTDPTMIVRPQVENLRSYIAIAYS